MPRHKTSNPLQDLRRLLKNKNWEEDISLWILLSALRGPDTRDKTNALKLRTTWRLRNAIASSFFGDAVISSEILDKPLAREPDFEFFPRIKALILQDFPKARCHFLDHYISACWCYWQEQAKLDSKRKEAKL